VTMIGMSEARPEDSGLASGLINTSGQVGGALGLAVLAVVAATQTSALTRSGAGALAALSGGFHMAWLVAAAFVVLTIGITVATLRPRSPAKEAFAATDVEDAA